MKQERFEGAAASTWANCATRWSFVIIAHRSESQVLSAPRGSTLHNTSVAFSMPQIFESDWRHRLAGGDFALHRAGEAPSKGFCRRYSRNRSDFSPGS